MPSYLVETYLARGLPGERNFRDERARSAAQQLKAEDVDVRFDHSIHVPEDELCFFVFDAPTSCEAVLAAELAGLEPLRVVRALASDVDPPDQKEEL